MKTLDKKIIKLNNGEKDLKVLVYLKKVKVRNNFTNIKAYCRIIG